ncbi:hypothetical protein QA597_10845 [Marinilabiliaceae bacterium ANBcel2]|nr:hypothetical protein [Marinilabiliaceae bacterium ANBcel2]
MEFLLQLLAELFESPETEQTTEVAKTATKESVITEVQAQEAKNSELDKEEVQEEVPNFFNVMQFR